MMNPELPANTRARARIATGIIYNGLGSIGLVSSELPPAYTSGAYFYENYKDNEKKKIPSEKLRDIILYFGQGNYENLKRGVVEQLSSYGMLSSNLINTMDLVEKAYQGRYRRTGEPEFAHILRIMGYTAEFVHTFNLWDPKREERRLLEDKYFDPDFMFRKPLVDMLFISILLHDFIEPEKKDDGKARLMGNVTFIGKTKSWQTLNESRAKAPERDPGIWIDRNEPDKDGIPTIAESVHITDIPESYFAHFIGGLDALDSFNISQEDEIIGQLGRTVYGLLKDLPSYYITPYFIPSLIKLFDRLDNAATYTFQQDELFLKTIPSEDKKIFDKVCETLQFAKLEEAIGRYISNIPLYVFAYAFTLGRITVGKYHPQFVAMMPSVWAKKTLLGYGINDIWIGRKSKSGHLIMPRLV